MEEWKDINGFKGYYQISNHGNVRSLSRYVTANQNGGVKLLKGRLMKLTFTKDKRNSDKDGYVVVMLSRVPIHKTYLVHVLVAEHFIENSNNLPTVNHKDGDKINNHYTNLEWCTFGENNQHALDHNLRSPRGRKILQYGMNDNYIETYKSVTDASRQTGIGRCNISNVLNGRTYSAGNFKWKYMN